MNRVRYYQIVKENRPKTHRFRDCLLAFLCGGTIGLLTQFLIDILSNYFDLQTSTTLASLIFVCIASVLTVLSIYSPLGQIFGAGLFNLMISILTSLITFFVYKRISILFDKMEE